eukprot:Protomagalhaensia_sp_Gyna_25__3249@NODE_2955_length_802_cov_14_269987_g2470_i0_p1_GENE_NODE_2955_length_802_cov_14_269987_g2470_i0NODE_2955_length_802_cov_14_269987_g2470_i0_p1_ORF_typecomplete_len252_score40_08DUF4763/PF15960_5/0_0014Kelch_4/PF13418_6/41Kelch_4/PF13418_6/0_55Kelch_3/PF13415_6/1_3Kelch_3/PF13415_6/2e02Kelch_3/PF13415_6/7e02ZapB/PF06005_12/0_013KASH_CCD/PF14662_6/0_012Chibby/PF14645_6/0_021APG6_N/PF17675_1/0_018JnkSapK_ap_N/PF09744_9/0_031Cnn_1N/PF07989_11/0_038Kelch_5/PF13854_6/
MLNSFYEFNFVTHEGRILRVELAVSPLKILPALVGHQMVCMVGEDGKPRLVIFGGINRQSTIVHVVYAMVETGKSPGIYSDEVQMPTMERQGLVEAVSPEKTSTRDKSLISTPRTGAAEAVSPATGPNNTPPPGDTPLLTTCNREPEVFMQLSSENKAAQGEVRQLQEENKQLKSQIIGLQKQLAQVPDLHDLCSLITNTNQAINQMVTLGRAWTNLAATFQPPSAPEKFE